MSREQRVVYVCENIVCNLVHKPKDNGDLCRRCGRGHIVEAYETVKKS